jgi:hypothetical protein
VGTAFYLFSFMLSGCDLGASGRSECEHRRHKDGFFLFASDVSGTHKVSGTPEHKGLG